MCLHHKIQTPPGIFSPHQVLSRVFLDIQVSRLNSLLRREMVTFIDRHSRVRRSRIMPLVTMLGLQNRIKTLFSGNTGSRIISALLHTFVLLAVSIHSAFITNHSNFLRTKESMATIALKMTKFKCPRSECNILISISISNATGFI